MTDNKNRTVTNIRTVFNKGGGSLGNSGTVGWMFDKKGLIVITTEGKAEEIELEAIDAGAAIVINPAGLSFRSIPVLDALKMFPGPIIELHISNIHRREAFRHLSLIAGIAVGQISGFGPESYLLGLRAAARLVAKARSAPRTALRMRAPRAATAVSRAKSKRR